MIRSLRVLAVCTGNICRSPMAEAALRQTFAGADDPSSVASAGTKALVDAPMPDLASQTLDELGIASMDHSARQLAPEMLEDADLILAMSREHRSAIVRILPRAVRSTFTIIEFARLTELVTDDDIADLEESTDPLRDAIPLAVRHRGQALLIGNTIDIADPYRRRVDAYRTAGSGIVQSAATIGQFFARIPVTS